MFKSKKPGITIVETLLVIAISTALFVVVIGVFNTRKRTQVDDAARQVMDEISKVRNQAQQGQGPSGSETLPSGNELFGQAIEFVQPDSNNGLTQSKMIVHKLMQDPNNKSISDYGSYEIQMPNQLQWNIYSVAPVSCGGNNFTTCVASEPPAQLNPLPNTILSSNLYMVFRVGSGASYLLNGDQANSSTYTYRNFVNYNSSNQPYLQLAFGIPNTGAGTRQQQMELAINRYFGLFDLKIANNQDLKVVK